MIIFNPYDFDFGYERPVQPAVRFDRNWIIGNLEKKTIGVDEVESKAAFQVTREFVAAAGQSPHNFKILNCRKIGQTLFDLLCLDFAMPFHEQAVVV
jgi:hypothetical protein